MAFRLKAVVNKQAIAASFDGNSIETDNFVYLDGQRRSVRFSRDQILTTSGLRRLLIFGNIRFFIKEFSLPIDITYSKELLRFIDPLFFVRLGIIAAVSFFTILIAFLRVSPVQGTAIITLIFHQAIFLYFFLKSLNNSLQTLNATMGILNILFALRLFLLDNNYLWILLANLFFYLLFLTIISWARSFNVLTRVSLAGYWLLSLFIVYLTFMTTNQISSDAIYSYQAGKNITWQANPCTIEMGSLQLDFTASAECQRFSFGNKLWINFKPDVYDLPFYSGFSVVAPLLFVRGKIIPLSFQEDPYSYMSLLQQRLIKNKKYFFSLKQISEIEKQNLLLSDRQIETTLFQVEIENYVSLTSETLIYIFFRSATGSNFLAVFEDTALKGSAYHLDFLQSHSKIILKQQR